jgi:hypothetical protein
LLAKNSSKNVPSADSSSNFVSFSAPRPIFAMDSCESALWFYRLPPLGYRRARTGKLTLSHSPGLANKITCKREQNYLNERRKAATIAAHRRLYIIKVIDKFFRNPMFTRPKRLQFVQEAAAQILDSPMPSGCAVTICAGRGGLACAGSVWRHALQVSDNRNVEGERLPVSRGHDEASRIDDW